MQNPEDLDDQLIEALTHLYDPDYQPQALLFALTGCDPEAGPLPVQSTLIRTIESLEPHGSQPTDAHLWRVHDVIHKRFVLKLTQEKTAELMDISVRHLNRVQREAVHTLAQLLWERWLNEPRRQRTSTETAASEETAADLQASDWQAQTERELASLQASAPGAVSDVGQTIQGVLELQNALPSGGGIQTGFIQPNLIAALHPSVLRQILITAIGRFARHRQEGPVTVFAGLEGGNVKITITCAADADSGTVCLELVRDILTPEGVTVDVALDEGHLFVSIRMPSAGGKITVLAVDDNADMAHFYRRCTAGTRYHLIHLGDGEDLIGVVKDIRPHVIVLDVMLPNVDGWKLLMLLHEDQSTRPIPVIICTVIREKELALSLGAAGYLAKPVRPREFIQALDQVLTQIPTRA